MSWTHSRDVTIRIPSINKFEPALLVTFRVEPDKKTQFGEILESYLKFCDESKAAIVVKDEITDYESGECCGVTFDIIGERQAVGMRLQQIGNDLLQHSTRTR